jgi:hypothetical protein
LPFVDLLIDRARTYIQLGRAPADAAAVAKLRALLEAARDAGFGPGFKLSPA